MMRKHKQEKKKKGYKTRGYEGRKKKKGRNGNIKKE